MVERGPSDPDGLASRVKALLDAGAVLVDEKPAARAPRPEEVRGVVLPLLEWCRGRPISDGRGVVGIVAPCGGGKSLLTAWLSAASKALDWAEFAFFSLDGYHFPNVVLNSRAGLDPDGNRVSMRDLKGAPASFDAEKLLADLRALKSGRAERLLPCYSRVLHDPAPDRIRIGPEVEWVFVEGNFLFLDAPPWREIRGLLDRKVYLDADDDALKERLARRHRGAGRDAGWIAAHLRRTDWPNALLIRSSARFADLAFRWDGSGILRPETHGI